MTLRSVINVLLIVAMANVMPNAGFEVGATGQDVIVQVVAGEVGELPIAAHRGPEKIKPESLGIATNAPSVVVRDTETGVELFSRGADISRPIASITKLMTALVLVDEYEWEMGDEATVLRTDVRDGGRWRFRFGDDLTMDDLFSMMLIASGNNEAMAMVREVGASEEEFVVKMNEKARELGMDDSQFAGPIGLNPMNRASAYDVQILLDEALKRPEIASRVSQSRVVVDSGAGRHDSVESTDKLFGSFLDAEPWDVVGGKTGSLTEAGYCLTTRISRDGHAVDMTILGASYPDGRFSDAKKLASWVFDVYKW